MSFYLTLIVGEASGVTPPALTAGMTAEYWEEGNNLRAEDAQLMTLTQINDVTETLLAGGVSLVAPFGASPFSFTPCMIGLRFWKLHFRLTIAGVAAIARPYLIQACLH